MLLAGTTEASPLKRRVDLTEVDLGGDNCSENERQQMDQTGHRMVRQEREKTQCPTEQKVTG